jgi:hypothetical protein
VIKMAVGDYSGVGSGTIPVSGPGDISTVAITCTGAIAADIVILNITSDIPYDVEGPFTFKAVAGTDIVTVTANRAQLPTAVTCKVMTQRTA